jgi:nitrogen fixation protein FixH
MIDQKPQVLFTGKHFLAWMLGAFAIVVVANAALIRFALTTHSGEVAHGAPPAGLRLAQVTLANVTDPGWALSMHQVGRDLFLTVDGVTQADIRISMRRPGANSPIKIDAVAAIGPTDWRTDLGALEPGQWDMEVTLTDSKAGATALRRTRILLP